MENKIIQTLGDLGRRVRKLETIEIPPRSAGLWADRPASPYNGQQYNCVDNSDKDHTLKLWTYSTSAGLWLGQPFQVTLTPENFSNPIPGTVSGGNYLVLYPILRNLWLEGLSVEISFGAAQTPTNFFTITGLLGTTAGVSSNGTPAGRKMFNFTESASNFTPIQVAPANFVIGASIVETGTATGTAYVQAAMQVRLVG